MSKTKNILELTIIDNIIDINCLKMILEILDNFWSNFLQFLFLIIVLGVRLPNTNGTRNLSSPYHWLERQALQIARRGVQHATSAH